MKNILVRKQESRPFPSAESPHGNRPWAIWKPTRRCLTLSTIFPRGQPSRSQGPGVTSSSWATHLRAPPHLRLHLQELPPLLLRVQAPLPLRPFILVGGSCSATPPPLGLPVAATARPPRGSAAAPPARPPAAVAPPLRLPVQVMPPRPTAASSASPNCRSPTSPSKIRHRATVLRRLRLLSDCWDVPDILPSTLDVCNCNFHKRRFCFYILFPCRQ